MDIKKKKSFFVDLNSEIFRISLPSIFSMQETIAIDYSSNDK